MWVGEGVSPNKMLKLFWNQIYSKLSVSSFINIILVILPESRFLEKFLPPSGFDFRFQKCVFVLARAKKVD
jgi:hypothetical protein